MKYIIFYSFINLIADTSSLAGLRNPTTERYTLNAAQGYRPVHSQIIGCSFGYACVLYLNICVCYTSMYVSEYTCLYIYIDLVHHNVRRV